jgi:hypothetical protein
MRPSLLIIPANETPGVLMPQIPFNGTADFTVSRTTTPANNSTRVNSSGLIEIVNDNVPRIDYLNQSCPALLVEPSAQNLVLRSEEFDNASWSKTDITVTTGSTSAFTAPDGTTNADLFTSTASAVSFLAQTITIASGAATFSVFAKAGNHGIFRIGNVSSAARAAWFDLNAGAVIGTVNGGTASIQNYGSGWYRCIFTASSVVSGGSTFIIAISDAANGTASVSGATMYAWGAQLETGSIATTYIPTTSGTASRNADVISASGALVSGLIGQTEGVLYCEFTLSSISDVIVVPNAYNSAQNYVGILHNGTNSLVLRIRYRSGGSNLNINFTQVATIGTTYKVAIGYKSGDSAAFVNGVQVGSTDTTAFAFENPLTLIEILVRQFYSSALFGPNRIRAVALYTTRLSNDDLIRLTLPSTYVTYNDMALGLAYTIK